MVVRIDELILDIDNRTPIEAVVMGNGRGFISLGAVTINADWQELEKISLALDAALRVAGYGQASLKGGS